MARIRTIKPEFWDDETISTLSRDARLLFIATFNQADDEGILRWTPEKLKALAFLYDQDVQVKQVEELMDELTAANLIAAYVDHGVPLAWVVNFHKHQRVNRPQLSKFKAPSFQNPSTALVYAERDHWMCHLCGGPVNRTPYHNPDPYSPTGPQDISPLNASLDHLLPRSQGGSDYPSNIRLAHIGCNKGRRDRAVGDFKQPTSVATALDSLTCDDASTVIVPGALSDDSLSVHGSSSEDSTLEVEVEVEEEECKSNSPSSATADGVFAEFWSAYPRKVGKDAARRAWKQATRRADPGAVVDGARRFAEDPNLPEPQYQPHPSTWLDAGRWDDEPCPPRLSRGERVDRAAQPTPVASMPDCTRHPGLPAVGCPACAQSATPAPTGWRERSPA